MDHNYLDSLRRIMQENTESAQHRHAREWPGYSNSNNSRNRTRPYTLLSNSERLYNLINDYNQNIQQYQENFLYMTSSLIQEMRNETSRRNRRAARQAEPRMHFEFIPTADLSSFFQNVTVAPTETQINDASEIITYNTAEPLNFTSCPITIENFEDGEQILVLNYCGHAFREEAIRNWFRSNVRCPVCRHDIRTRRGNVSPRTNRMPPSPIETHFEPTQNPPAPSPTRNPTPDTQADLAELSGGVPLSRSNSYNTTQNIQNIIEQTINALQTQIPNSTSHYITMDIPVQFDASFQEQTGDEIDEE